MHEDAPVGSDSCRLEAYSDRKSRVQVSHAFFSHYIGTSYWGQLCSFRRNVQEHQNLVKGCKRSPPVPYGHKASCPGGRGIGQRQTRKDSPRPKRFEIAIGQHTPRP